MRLAFPDEGDTLEIEVHNVVVANGQTVAGGISIAPRAAVDDGLLDCVVITAVEGLDIASLGARVLLGRHLDGGDERIVFRRCRVLEVAADPPMPFHADGEPLAGERLSFAVRPRALSMVVGPRAVARSGSGTESPAESD